MITDHISRCPFTLLFSNHFYSQTKTAFPTSSTSAPAASGTSRTTSVPPRPSTKTPRVANATPDVPTPASMPPATPPTPTGTASPIATIDAPLSTLPSALSTHPAPATSRRRTAARISIWTVCPTTSITVLPTPELLSSVTPGSLRLARTVHPQVELLARPPVIGRSG